MWIIPSELTDALKGIGNALGGNEQGPTGGGDDEQWVDTGDATDDAFAETVLEDPAKALAEARDQAAAASAESTEHTAPVGRQQPSMHPRGADVPPPPAAAPPTPSAATAPVTPEISAPAAPADLPDVPPAAPTQR